MPHDGCLVQDTGVHATRIAALVWGRDDDTAKHGLAFKQQDIDKIVEAADHRTPFANMLPLKKDSFQALLCLTVSDLNKELLLKSDGLVPLLVDSLLLDPDHPRRAQGDFDAVAPPVQRVRRSSLRFQSGRGARS